MLSTGARTAERDVAPARCRARLVLGAGIDRCQAVGIFAHHAAIAGGRPSAEGLSSALASIKLPSGKRDGGRTDVIDVYTWTTGNGRKIPIFLEETGTPYRLHMVDINNGEQWTPEFIAINPNSKIPAIIDQDGPGGKPLTMFESGAILIYLAEKTGKLIPKDPVGRYHTIQWVMFQMANIGPLLGQTHHFRSKAPDNAYGVKRYTDEATRLWKVLDKRLGEAPYLAGGEYTIADIATYVWLRNPKNQGQDVADYPNVKRWFDAIDARPAVTRAHKAVEEAAEKYKAAKQAR
jgi:GST-like protein